MSAVLASTEQRIKDPMRRKSQTNRNPQLLLRGSQFLPIQLDLTIYVGGNFSSLRNGRILAMHEKEEWGGGKEDYGCGDHAARHRSRMTTPARFLHCPKCDLVPVPNPYVINIHIKIPATSHT